MRAVPRALHVKRPGEITVAFAGNAPLENGISKVTSGANRLIDILNRTS
jgi:hypothetical protein